MRSKKERSTVAGLFSILVSALVLVLFAVPAFAAPDISGHWYSNIGNEYDIAQQGNVFEWHVPQTGQIGGGSISGNTAKAAWPFGYAEGNIITDPSGWAVEIHWSNGVVFTRGGGGTPPPGGGTPGGGGDVNFSFGPNPARKGGEVWLDLTQPVGNQILVFLNGVNLPIISTKGSSYVVVSLPMNATPGPIEIEYQGRRIQSNQPKNVLDIAQVDISGNWRNHANGYDYHVNQGGDNYDVKWTNPAGLIIIGTDTGNGKVYDGNKLNVHWGSKPPSMNLNDVATITDIDPNGRAHRIQWNSGDVWDRP